MTGRRRLGAILVAAVATLSIGALTRVPYPAATGEDAVLRLSWRMVSERVEACRELSQEEIERLPVHMRRDRVCEGRVIPYRLAVRLAGQTVVTRRVEPSGARGDGPLYVYEELRLRPGSYTLEVEFEPLPPPGRYEATAVPSTLTLHAPVDLGTREIVLITLLPGTRTLVVRDAAPDPGR